MTKFWLALCALVFAVVSAHADDNWWMHHRNHDGYQTQGQNSTPYRFIPIYQKQLHFGEHRHDHYDRNYEQRPPQKISVLDLLVGAGIIPKDQVVQSEDQNFDTALPYDDSETAGDLADLADAQANDVAPRYIPVTTGDRHGVPLPRVVRFTSDLNPGDIYIDSEHFKLYFVLNQGEAIEYRIAVGKQGYEWAGTALVSDMKVNPPWYPTARMRTENPQLPEMIPGGAPDNPFGPRAMYLADSGGDTGFRIHGTIHPESIGHTASSGCIRMLNDDVSDLFGRVRVGATVVVAQSSRVTLY